MTGTWLNVCFNAMLEYIPENFTTAEATGKFRSVITHIDVIGSYLDSETTLNDDVAKFFSMAGIGHKEVSNYDTALEYYSKSVSIREKNGNEKGLGVIYNNIGAVYCIVAKYKLALENYHKAIELSERHNALPIDLVVAYNNLSIVYLKCTLLDKAIDWNTKALKLAEKNKLIEDPIMADVYIMGATIHYTNEAFEEALELDFKALELLKTHYSEHNADVGTAYNSIAREYYSLKRFDTALEYFLKAYKIYESVYSENDSDTAEVCGSIANTYMKLQENNKALEWCLKALQTQERILGHEHPEVILRCSFISDIYENLGLICEAIIYLKRILDFFTKRNYIDGINILRGRIADDYERIENFAEANKYREKVLLTGERHE